MAMGQCKRDVASWISNYIYTFMWDVITHPCPNFNGSLANPPQKLDHGWAIISHNFKWDVITHPCHVPCTNPSMNSITEIQLYKNQTELVHTKISFHITSKNQSRISIHKYISTQYQTQQYKINSPNLGPFSVSCPEWAQTMLSQSQARLLK